MILWEAVLLATATTVMVVNGRAPQHTHLNTALVNEQENTGDLNIDQRSVPVKLLNLHNGLVREENDLDNTELVQEQSGSDDAIIQQAFDMGLVREQNNLEISEIADSDDLENNLLEDQHYLDVAGITIDKTGLSRNSDKRNLLDLWQTIIETNRSCSPTVSCSHAGGHCFTSGSKCNGTVDAYGCIGGGRCMCCIPDKTAMVPNTTTTASTTTTSGYSSPWITLGGGCYLFGQSQMNWTSARTNCEYNGGQLAILNTEAKRIAITDYIVSSTSSSYCWWLGGSNLSGTWLFLDNSTVTTDVWNVDQNEPDDGSNACMYTTKYQVSAGEYDLILDMGCSVSFYPICEK